MIDVARLAGVGKTTVSAVVHGRAHVAPELRERVLAAIEKLSYRPNISARNLKLRRTDVIGVAMGDLLDPFNAEITAYMERRAAHHGLKILLTTSGMDQAHLRAVGDLMSHPVAAVLFMGAVVPTDLAKLSDPRVPFIFVSQRNKLGPSITVDNLRGGELATSHLLELGHRRIVYLSVGYGPVSSQEYRARLAGYRRALKRSKASIAEQVVRLAPSLSLEQRREALVEILTSRRRPTAIFAATDQTALELMQLARDLHLDVPEDISIVGFDNIAFAAYSTVALTTIAQPVEDLACRAVDIAKTMLDGGAPVPGTAALEPTLVVRRSTAPPRSLRA
ncbi:MAG TPA: LacI family DNA-binding transcriptional regulator [Solirubrobacteraceae bacterium]|nr:LacI family DNA-binding transcriptional regulator [Solirubrobacteraceae bacterium]